MCQIDEVVLHCCIAISPFRSVERWRALNGECGTLTVGEIAQKSKMPRLTEGTVSLDTTQWGWQPPASGVAFTRFYSLRKPAKTRVRVAVQVCTARQT
ncbi:MAG: hypothetical protein ACFFH0_12405, partial [Promethearchaeota archaeon]